MRKKALAFSDSNVLVMHEAVEIGLPTMTMQEIKEVYEEIYMLDSAEKQERALQTWAEFVFCRKGGG